METLTDALYVYAHENRILGYLQTAEYRRAVGEIEKGWEAFRADLTVEQGSRLGVLLSRENEINLLEDQAAFLAGISIGLELGRL